MAETIQYSHARTVSRKKYYEIRDSLQSDFDIATVELILQKIKSVLALDPDMSSYTPEKNEKNKAWRHRKIQEDGMSGYVLSGRKKQYEHEKALKGIYQPSADKSP
jgi:hypothetical protein